jgi:hypothetical protein
MDAHSSGLLLLAVGGKIGGGEKAGGFATLSLRTLLRRSRGAGMAPDTIKDSLWNHVETSLALRPRMPEMVTIASQKS